MSQTFSSVEKMRTTLELFEAAVDIMRQNLRRRHPGARPEEIHRMLQEWLDKGDDAPTPPAKARRKRMA